MCGPNSDCNCSIEERLRHNAAHSKWTANAGIEIKPGTALDEAKLTAALAEGDPAPQLPQRWHAVLTVEGLRTTDHRAIARNALTWRQLPLPFMAQFLNAGHYEAYIIGSIETITRDGDFIMAEGSFNLTLEEGRQAAQMCLDQSLRWNSIDLEVLESRYVEVTTGGEETPMDIIDILFDDDIGGGSGATDWYDEVLSGRIMGSTMVPMPAFPQAVCAPLDMALDIPDPMGAVPMVSEGMLASGKIEPPTSPPASWFADPVFSEATPMTIEEDGHIYGHLALWNTCHTGFEDVCIVPPHSQKDYAYFKTGKIETANGEVLSAGQITFDTGHAGATMGWQDTTAHYDHTGAVAADVTIGEDEFGIWFSGALRPGLSDEDVRTVRAAALSGDWRKIGNGLELVAALAVNVPGFPIVASAGVKNAEQVSLIAGGVKRRDPIAELAREVATIKRTMKPLLGLSVERLSARVNTVVGLNGERVSNDPANFVTMNGKSRQSEINKLKERVNAS